MFLEKQSTKTIDKKQSIKNAKYREEIIRYLSENDYAKCSTLSSYIGVSDSRTRVILRKMIEESFLVADGENRNRVYKLNV